jgi:molecular chaperone GrpE
MKHKDKEKSKDQHGPKTETGEVDKLRQQAETLQKEKDELFGKLQRVSADYINYQKRVSKQTADTIAYEKEKIIKTLLPALDNFEHTLQNAASVEDKDVLLKGVRIIYDQILAILKSHGVERIDALGAKFDPAMHEAVSHKTEPQKDENIVLEEFQKGYKLNDRVLRPSRVIVNKLPAEQQPAEQEQPPDDQTVDLNAEIVDLEDQTPDMSGEQQETSDE